MKSHQNYKRVDALIKVGAENAITCREIADRLNLTPRAVRECIRILIINYKTPIIGKRKGRKRGYFIPRNNNELHQGIQSLNNQLSEEQKRLTVLLETDLTNYVRR